MDLYIIVSKGSLSKRKSYCLRLGGCQFDLDKIPQLLHRPYHCAFFICHIELFNFLTRSVSGIGHIHRHRQFFCVFHCLFVQTQIAVGKCGIGQSVAEGEQYIHFLLIIIAVSHENGFPVFHVVALTEAGKIRRIIFQLLRECLRKLRTGIHLAEEDVILGTSHSLSSKIGFQNTFHTICPGHLYRCTVVQYDYGVRLYRCHSFDQFVLAIRHPHMFTIKTFGFKCIRQSCENHGCLCLFSCLYGFCQ